MNYSGNNNGSVFLQKLEEIVIQNLENEQFGVSELADNIGISRSQLHRKVKKLCNKSISRFIRDIKLNEALELLKDDTLTVSEVAYNVGFSNPSYFNNCFHERYGLSPGEIKGKKQILLPVEKVSDKPKITPFFKTQLFIVSVVLILIAVIFFPRVLPEREKKVEKNNSIAILPFDNLSSDSENQYFADGIVEDLLNRLSKLDGLKVISRTSSEKFRNRGENTIPEIAKILGVSYIMEGSVQREKNKIRIYVQLIDATRDDHVFSRQYDRELREVFTIQSEIAGEIAQELSFVVSEKGGPDFNINQTENIQAYDYYQMARFYTSRRTKQDILNIIHYYKLAIGKDPDFAKAYSGIGGAYWMLSLYGFLPVEQGIDSMRFYIEKSLKLDSNISETHLVLGFVNMEYEFNMDAAKEEFIKALELNPNSSSAYRAIAIYFFIHRDYDKAREYIDKAVVLDPFSFVIRIVSGDIYLAQGNLKMALSESKISQELDRSSWIPPKNAFYINIQLGDIPAAINSFKELGEITGEFTSEIVDSIYNTSGINGLFELRSRTVEKPSDKGEYFVFLGEYDKAIEKLKESYNDKTLAPYFMAMPSLKPLWTHPKFKELQNKMDIHPIEE